MFLTCWTPRGEGRLKTRVQFRTRQENRVTVKSGRMLAPTQNLIHDERVDWKNYRIQKTLCTRRPPFPHAEGMVDRGAGARFSSLLEDWSLVDHGCWVGYKMSSRWLVCCRFRVLLPVLPTEMFQCQNRLLSAAKNRVFLPVCLGSKRWWSRWWRDIRTSG